MDPTLLDVVLGLALAYSATYVLYCWVHADDRKRKRERSSSRAPHRHSSKRTLA